MPPVCRQMGVARSGFYAWRQRQQNPSSRVLENAGSLPRCRKCLKVTGASTAHHASIRSSGPQASRWAVTVLSGSCAAPRSKPRPAAGSDPAATVDTRPLEWLRTCCRSSAQPPQTSAGPKRSPTAAPRRAANGADQAARLLLLLGHPGVQRPAQVIAWLQPQRHHFHGFGPSTRAWIITSAST